MQQLSLFDDFSTTIPLRGSAVVHGGNPQDHTASPVEYYPGFLHSSEANALFEHCKTLQWQQNEIKMLGKPLQVPRLECMYGTLGASYIYSGSVNLEALPWTEELLNLCDRITAFCNHEFDIVIGNRYRSGQDSIGWHSDDEPSMGYRPAIASISLGACRKFSIKPKLKESRALTILRTNLILSARVLSKFLKNLTYLPKKRGSLAKKTRTRKPMNLI